LSGGLEFLASSPISRMSVGPIGHNRRRLRSVLHKRIVRLRRLIGVVRAFRPGGLRRVRSAAVAGSDDPPESALGFDRLFGRGILWCVHNENVPVLAVENGFSPCIV
jgi:hypothetical protein